MVILIVDDERGLTRLLQEALEAEGDVCLVAQDVAEAEMILRTTKVDAMALDLGMPGRDPFEWFLELKSLDPSFARRTLITTGRGLADEEVARIEATGAGVLPKPFRLKQLREALHQRLGPSDA